MGERRRGGEAAMRRTWLVAGHSASVVEEGEGLSLSVRGRRMRWRLSLGVFEKLGIYHVDQASLEEVCEVWSGHFKAKMGPFLAGTGIQTVCR
jgi:hypothetical protein